MRISEITHHFRSQCTFWCSVLSDGNLMCSNVAAVAGSQCTFWCSVLSDDSPLNAAFNFIVSVRLNAPSGAQCFPTRRDLHGVAVRFRVSMHLLVLSAFRHRRCCRV